MASTFHVYFAANGITGSPKPARLEPADCFAALTEGFDDVVEMPTYPAFLGLFYALAGVTLVSLTSFANALQLAFPLASGFALLGPFVAVGLYEMSRAARLGFEPRLARRLRGRNVRPLSLRFWRSGFSWSRSSPLGSARPRFSMSNSTAPIRRPRHSPSCATR